MDTPHLLHSVAPDLWSMRFPLKMLGADLRRNVAIIRLNSGQLIIHSTAPFTEEDVAAIRELGEPAWLVDPMLRHTTFANEGRAAFPQIPYYAPVGFEEEVEFPISHLLSPPGEWAEEVEVLPIDGMPEFMEYALLHRASRTLIVCDLLFNFGPDETTWTEIILKVATVGGGHCPGITKPFKSAVEDESAFLASIRQILSRDFDRIMVGHGDIIENSGKALLTDSLREAGFELT